MANHKTLDDLFGQGPLTGKHVLVRADLNVPVNDAGDVSDATRLERLLPTLKDLSAKGAKIGILSHFGRPKGERKPEMSLKPIAAALSDLLGAPVAFAEDCIGFAAGDALSALSDGGVVVLENTRFHIGEEKNDKEFSEALAANAEIYVNDAFSTAHRAHGSTEGIAHLLPAFAGRAMEQELDA
ncbi:MAG: phosphoglycerate kinase, partial [Parvibaculum sp.]|nr:phosphoglycerate kinase [Parvibaculum sp.]